MMRRLRAWLLPWLDGAALLLFRMFAPSAGLKRSNAILVIRADYIGDFFVFLDAAKGIREHFPEAKIHLLCNQGWAELAEESSLFDTIWLLDRWKFLNNPFYRYHQLWRLRAANFGQVLNPTYSRELLVGDSVCRFAGAPARIGFDGDLTNISERAKNISDSWYTKLIRSDHKMELMRGADFVRSLGHLSFRASLPIFKRRRPAPSPTGRQERYFLLFPGASWAGRKWPADNFAAAAEALAKELGMKGVLAGGAEDKEFATRIKAQCKAPLEDLTGSTSLLELTDLIRNAAFVLSNETSAVHIAASTGTRCFCLLGGGHWGRFLPYVVETNTDAPLPTVIDKKMDCYFCNWNCIYPRSEDSPTPCVEGISVEEVMRIILRELRDRA